MFVNAVMAVSEQFWGELEPAVTSALVKEQSFASGLP